MKHDLSDELSQEIKKYERRLLQTGGVEDLSEPHYTENAYLRLKYFISGMKRATSIVEDYLWREKNEKDSL
jgi:hypothetical protein